MSSEISTVPSLNDSEIAARINALHKNAMRLRNEAEAAGQAAVVDAVNCGRELLRVKAMVGHGKFRKWVADNCPTITSRTATNWMRVASNEKVLSHLSELKTLQAAYIAVGILPEPEQSKGIGTAAVACVEEVVAKLKTKVEQARHLFTEAVNIPEDKRGVLADALKPLVDLYHTLTATA